MGTKEVQRIDSRKGKYVTIHENGKCILVSNLYRGLHSRSMPF
jgi:hypothetical protein